MTKNGIVHLAFHPCTDSLVLAAADKSGHIGLWSVDNEARPASASESKENQAQGAAQQDAEQPKSGVHVADSVIAPAESMQCINWAQQ